MTGASFVHLHNHTEYSMLDGLAKVGPLFAEAERSGMPAVGMSDHGNMYGAAEFFRRSQQSVVKPIIGIEAYIAPESRFSGKRVRWGDPSQKADDVSGSGAYLHMTMFAENAVGLRNLFRLSSLASFEGQLGKWPRMDAELIAEHAAGIIATTGCPSGEVQTRLRLGQFEAACAAAGRWRDIFGPENFFLEVMDHGLTIERRVREDLLAVGKKAGLTPLATNDCHYVLREHASAHEAMLCVQTGKTLSDPARFRFDGDGYYLKSAAEMRALWDDEVPGACDATLAIAARVEPYDVVWEFQDRMPVFPVPDGETEDTWLRREVDKGLRWRFPTGVPETYRERAHFELDIIRDKGFPAYFLVVGDLVTHARRVGIRVGPGRGSAAGSLVAYALAITNIDPIEHGLLFERFLNPERPSAPDIDIDFDDRRRGEMIRYATERWGADKVAQVITFGTIKTKAALKDAARVHFGQPGFAIADRITKALPPAVAAKDISVSGITDPAHERYGEAAEVRALVDGDPIVRQIYDTAVGLEGMVRGAGVHACAVILSRDPLLDVVPLWKRPQDGAIITGWDYPSCESIGLLKMDFLGLRTLTVIGDCLDNIRANRGVDIDLDTLVLDDEGTYAMLARGDNLGVFQMDSAGMRELLLRMAPTEFNDLVASNALYRPGPMGVGAHWAYADRKNGREAVTPIHPELDESLRDILSETYALIVYQEQIMQLAQRVAGYSLGQADLLRRAMGKKKPEVLAMEFENFRKGMLDNGYGDAAITALWEAVLPFAGYAYNKSHAAGYSLVMYWTAYLKANYPAEFMAALLTSVGDDKDKSAIYLADCRKRGIRVMPPDVNHSVGTFSCVADDIRFGLGAVRNVGEPVVEAIVRARNRGAFTSFSDFLAKVDAVACGKKVVESLVKAGAFDSLGHPRHGLHLIHGDAVDAVMTTKKAAARGQFDLFAADFAEPDTAVSVFDVPVPNREWDRGQLLGFEREMLGLYVSGHPLDAVAHLLATRCDTSISALTETAIPHGSRVVVGGIVAAIDRRVNKKGDPWAIVRLEDLDASIEVLFFPAAFAHAASALTEDAIVVITAHISVRDNRLSVLGDQITVPDLAGLSAEQPLTVTIPVSACTPHSVRTLRETLQRHPGGTAVRINLLGKAGPRLLAVDARFQVTTSPALMGELKALFGQSCLASSANRVMT
ncbi:DNA polymerase III subunit alpha [Nocardia sp. SYP-A9097]|uniref:DNA polymerase III subunit alpha n=1 Tax=Nocardia sp. SYP-A9097 TaxID=2663237 RepID=UPI00129C0C41|nr:DNA polymerase III subunit alpha [Nocardia sp. SYP-A9097]MRH93055.1 DNA polymerase III subunit alpha [Nocardia sp. SYP-A9097]